MAEGFTATFGGYARTDNLVGKADAVTPSPAWQYPVRMAAPNMSEVEARDLLRRWPGGGELENWIAERRWQVTPDGWNVTGELQGRRFKVEVMAEGLRVSAYATGEAPAAWIVTI